MKTILLTGATGFLGSYLLEALVNSNYKVVVFKRSTSDVWRIKHLLKNVVLYDVDQVPVSKAFQQQEIDIVIHTACNYGRDQSFLSDVVNGNLVFPLQILEEAIKNNVEVFFNTDTLLPDYINTYSLSKSNFTEWLKHLSDKIKCVNLRLEHIYGPKDDKNKFIAWLLDQMLNKHGKIDLTKGTQKRDFIYIDDVVSVYMTLLNRIDKLSNWNEFDVGSGHLVTVKSFIQSLCEVVEISSKASVKSRLNFGAVKYRKGEVMEPIVNNTKLLQIGWYPKIELSVGLKRTVEGIM